MPLPPVFRGELRLMLCELGSRSEPHAKPVSSTISVRLSSIGGAAKSAYVLAASIC